MKQEIRRLLEQKNKPKVKKTTDIEEIRFELRDTMGRRHRHVTDEDDEENLGGDDDDVYMYLADMHPDERHAYREAVRASKATEWNRQQEEHFIKGKRKTSIILI